MPTIEQAHSHPAQLSDLPFLGVCAPMIGPRRAAPRNANPTRKVARGASPRTRGWTGADLIGHASSLSQKKEELLKLRIASFQQSQQTGKGNLKKFQAW